MMLALTSGECHETPAFPQLTRGSWSSQAAAWEEGRDKGGSSQPIREHLRRCKIRAPSLGRGTNPALGFLIGRSIGGGGHFAVALLCEGLLDRLEDRDRGFLVQGLVPAPALRGVDA